MIIYIILTGTIRNEFYVHYVNTHEKRSISVGANEKCSGTVGSWILVVAAVQLTLAVEIKRIFCQDCWYSCK